MFNAFKLMARLGRERVQSESSGMIKTDTVISDSVRTEPDIGVTATRTDNGAIQILLWNYHDVADRFDEATPVRVSLSGITARHAPAGATLTRVDAQHANAFTLWQSWGEPQDMTPAQIAQLHQAATLVPEPLPAAKADNGGLTFDVSLLRHSVALIEVPAR